MSSKSSSQSKKSISEDEGTKSSSPPVQTRPRREKHIPLKLSSGIDKQIPGVPSKTKEKDVPAQSVPNQSEPKKKDASKRKHKESAKEPSKKRVKLTASQSRGSTQGQSSMQTRPQDPTPPIRAINNYLTPPWYCSETPITFSPQDLDKFKSDYASRDFCPIVYLNLDKLKRDCNLDLTPWFDQFKNFLSIKVPYSPLAVRTFFYNMSVYNIMDKDDNVAEEQIITSLRGKKITITVNSLNSLLGISNPPPPAEIHYSNEDIYQLLMPDQPLPEPLGKLSLKPIEMSPTKRALWYIYSRNLVQKGKNFTHFTQKDYTLFASIIKKVPHNLGHWIFSEIKKYKLHSKPNSTIPFPNLVSLILFSEKIWYLEKGEKPTKVLEFDQHHLNMMKISFKEGLGKSKAPSHPQGSPSRAQEAQSAPPPSIPSLPNDFESRIKTIIDQALSEMHIKFQESIDKVTSEIHQNHSILMKAQKRLDSHIENLFECFESHTDLLTDLQNKIPNPSSSNPVQTSSHFPISSPTRSSPILNDDKGGENKGKEKEVTEVVQVTTESAEVVKEPQMAEVAAEPVMTKVAEIAAEYAESSEPKEPEVADNANKPQDQE